ncbi:hypothetical protein ACPA5B_09325 [Pseudomonas solani]|uniref:hypothetical protein n=1 Tax=Pseudomonas solani TaxID=2731552 RepID=UPI003C2D349E
MTTQCVTSLIDRLNLQHLLESLDEPENVRSQPPLPPLGPLYEGRSYAFERLFDAVWLEPHRLNKLLAAERSLVMATDWTGENVLHWMAVENRVREIELLRALGSPIPPYALIEAMDLGHCETVILLLELGVEVNLTSCRNAFAVSSYLPPHKRRLIRSYFQQYGHDLDSPSPLKPGRSQGREEGERRRKTLRTRAKPSARRPNRHKQARRPMNHLHRQLQAQDA